jgi:hypothetical protein
MPLHAHAQTISERTTSSLPASELRSRPERAPKRPRASWSLPLLLASVAACGATGEPSPSGVPLGDQPGVATEAEGINGTLVHSESFGEAITVEFWKTEAGVMTMVTGSMDREHALSDQIAAALDRPSVAEAFTALTGREDSEIPEAIRELQTEAERQSSMHYLNEQEREAHKQLESQRRELLTGADAALDHQPHLPRAGQLRTLAATPAGFDWNADYQSFRNSYCGSAEDCRTGFTWIYGGTQTNLNQHKLVYFNNSFEGNAAMGVRSARPVSGTWTYTNVVNRSLAARTYSSLTYYGLVGQLRRDGWISGMSVSGLTQPMPNFTNTKLNPDPRVSFAQDWIPFTLKGSTASAVSTRQNRCTNDVGLSFAYLSPGPMSKIDYRSNGGSALPPFGATLADFYNLENIKHHVQGVGRLSGLGDSRWIAVSRSFSTGRGGVFLAHMGDLPGYNGEAFGNAQAANPSTSRATKYFYPIADVEHPGGLQAFGAHVAVAVEAPARPSFIQFYDFYRPGSPDAAIHRFYTNNTQNEDPPVDRVLSGVGVTRLSDSRYLMAVLGQDSSQRAWFYVSQGTSINASTVWHYLGTVTVPAAQNVALINECGTGDIYMLATNNARYSWAQTNRFGNDAYLRHITYQDLVLKSTPILDQQFDSGTGDYCTFRAGVSPYTDKSGNFSLLCHTRHAPSTPGEVQKLKLAEFTKYL